MQTGLPLSPPLPGKTGWPWNFQPEKVPLNLPRVTIVTPSYNQGEYLEETIRSVLLQGYPNLEYFIIDGGSTDGSIDIIRKYEPWLAGWVSERDTGQSSAINKGFSWATGQWLGWINSDDCFAPHALFNLIKTASDTQANFVYGLCVRYGEAAPFPYLTIPGPMVFDPEVISVIDVIDQPATLWTRQLFEECGPLDENLHYAFDWDYFIKCAAKSKSSFCCSLVAAYRLHSSIKSHTTDLKRSAELIEVSQRYLPANDRRRLLRLMPLVNFLKHIKAFGKKGQQPFGIMAKGLLFLLSNCWVLRLFGLPLELWATLEISYCFRKGLKTFRYADSSAITVSDALNCFPDELIAS
jgi:glycosyltransferase involved in cell wall biosynthesis